MTHGPAPLPPFTGNLEPVLTGAWAGWHRWAGNDPFEDGIGPFFVRRTEHGIETGFLPVARNLNGHGIVHGGCLMTFADYSLFMIAGGGGTEINGVTVTMSCEFVGAAQAGTLLTARGDLVRAGGSLVFARGMVFDSERPVLAFSGTIKRAPAPSSH